MHSHLQSPFFRISPALPDAAERQQHQTGTASDAAVLLENERCVPFTACCIAQSPASRPTRPRSAYWLRSKNIVNNAHVGCSPGPTVALVVGDGS
jgi:hypothetical protein